MWVRLGQTRPCRKALVTVTVRGDGAGLSLSHGKTDGMRKDQKVEAWIQFSLGYSTLGLLL